MRVKGVKHDYRVGDSVHFVQTHFSRHSVELFFDSSIFLLPTPLLYTSLPLAICLYVFDVDSLFTCIVMYVMFSVL